MKILKTIAVWALVAGFVGVAAAADKAATEAKPYPLKTCIVADEKLDHDTFTFVYQGQEFKICCESCKKDFDKAPAKYVKKLAAATPKK